MYKTIATVIIYSDKPIKNTGMLFPATDKNLVIQINEHQDSEKVKEIEDVFGKLS